jgi:hypothetical protein
LNNSHHYAIESDVLLIYVYANVHEHAYGNLKYFIDNAVREKDGVDYIFILQQIDNKQINESAMPLLPKSNAFYIQHENRCFDYGTIGWFLTKYTIGNPWAKQTSITDSNNTNHERIFNLTQYKYFIFMNSSVRGPFFPPYFSKFLLDYEKDFEKSFYWYYVFTKRINHKVKLVGCTISCTGPRHAQSYFLTTDFIGLSVLLQNPDVFDCFRTQQETIWYSEMRISERIFDANYQIDSLLTLYQSVDFSSKGNYKCPIDGNPYANTNMEDGKSLDPYEAVFAKFTGRIETTDIQDRGTLYQRWMEEAKKKE